MAGTAKGGKSLRETMIKRYGSEAAWKDHLRQIGRKGGSAKVKKGFATLTPEEHRLLSSKGGSRSRITAKVEGIDYELSTDKDFKQRIS